MFTINNHNKIFAFAIIVLFSLAGTCIFAGTTGKIAGKITDKNTGEALIGANVILIGTALWGHLLILTAIILS